MTPQPLDEQALEGVRSGRPDALEAVYRTYASPLLGWVRSQGTDVGEAEEVVEETFLELVRDCRSITGDGRALRAWLYQATRRNLIDHHRAQQRDRSVPSPTLPDHPTAERLPEEVVADRTLDGPVEDALRALSPSQREAVTLRYLSDLSVAEIATVTGRSRVAVRQLLHTGRRSMAHHLERRPVTGEEVRG